MTAAERETGDAGCRDDSKRHGLAEGLGGVIDFAGGATRARPHCPIFGIDSHALHCRQVDDQAVVDAAETWTVVSAAANSDRKLIVPAEIHRSDHVSDIGASGN